MQLVRWNIHHSETNKEIFTHETQHSNNIILEGYVDLVDRILNDSYNPFKYHFYFVISVFFYCLWRCYCHSSKEENQITSIRLPASMTCPALRRNASMDIMDFSISLR